MTPMAPTRVTAKQLVRGQRVRIVDNRPLLGGWTTQFFVGEEVVMLGLDGWESTAWFEVQRESWNYLISGAALRHKSAGRVSVIDPQKRDGYYVLVVPADRAFFELLEGDDDNVAVVL